MKKFTVACYWTMYGEEEVEAETLEEAMAKLDRGDKPYEDLPSGEYVDGSFEINVEVSEELNLPIDN